MKKFTFRKPVITDVTAIVALINHFAEKRVMLPRAVVDVLERVRDFTICEMKGRIIGCVALHVLWEDTGEIRSLAVIESAQKKGIGRGLVDSCLRDASMLGIPRVLALTYEPEFFMRFGFQVCPKETLPRKIWKDCIYCPFFPKCDETAMVLHLEATPEKSSLIIQHSRRHSSPARKKGHLPNRTRITNDE